jgi:uncharacterized protein with HEPN domain
LYILTALEASEKIFVYTTAYSSSADLYEANDQMGFNAVCHLLLTIGEETRKIDIRLKEEIGLINWEQITGMRNRLAHDYRGIDRDLVFAIVKTDLPILQQALLKMLKLLSPDMSTLQTYLATPWYSHVAKLLTNGNY